MKQEKIPGIEKKSKKAKKRQKNDKVDTLHVPICAGNAGEQVKDPRITRSKQDIQDDDTDPSSECDESLEANYYREQDEQHDAESQYSTPQNSETAVDTRVKQEEGQILLDAFMNVLQDVVTGSVNGSSAKASQPSRPVTPPKAVVQPGVGQPAYVTPPKLMSQPGPQVKPHPMVQPGVHQHMQVGPPPAMPKERPWHGIDHVSAPMTGRSKRPPPPPPSPLPRPDPSENPSSSSSTACPKPKPLPPVRGFARKENEGHLYVSLMAVSKE